MEQKKVVKIWFKVGSQPWTMSLHSDSMTALNRQKIVVSWKLFGSEVCTVQSESWEVLLFFPEQWSLVKPCSDVFRSSILDISFPGNNIRKFPVGNIIDTNSVSTKNIFGETASEFSFQNSHQIFPLWILYFKLKVTVGWPFFNLSFRLYYYLSTDTISLAMPI